MVNYKSKVDDMIAHAVGLGLSEGRDLASLTKPQLWKLIKEAELKKKEEVVEVNKESLDIREAIKTVDNIVKLQAEPVKGKYSSVYPKDFCDLAKEMYGQHIDALSANRVEFWVEKVYEGKYGKPVEKIG